MRETGNEVFHKGQGAVYGYNLTCSGLHTDLSVYMYIQTCMFCCRATHSSSQTAGSIDAFMWSTAQSRARSQCVYVCVCVCVCARICACVRVCVCACVWNPGFSPLGTRTNTLPIFPLSFTFKGSTRSAVNHPLSQSRPFILSLFIDQGWFKRTYVMWLEFLPWLILIL